MGRLGQGPQMIPSFLREGTPDPPISRPKPAQWEGRGILGRRSRRPAGSNLERLDGAPSRVFPGARGRAESPTCSVHLPAHGARGRPSVSQSFRPSASPRAVSLHGRPAGPAPPGARPAPRRAPDSQRGAGPVGAQDASLGGLGGAGEEKGGEGARAQGALGGGRSSAQRCIHSDSSRSAGQVGAPGASLPGWAGPCGRGGEGARARRAWGRWPGKRAVSRPLLAPGSARGALRSARRASARAASAAAAPPPPLRRFLPLAKRKAFFPPLLSALSGIEGAEGRGVSVHI